MSSDLSRSSRQTDSGAAMPRDFRIASGEVTTYADATAVRRAVLVTQTTTERASRRHWRIGIIAVYVGFAVLLATVA
jgi:hypothetical protein